MDILLLQIPNRELLLLPKKKIVNPLISVVDFFFFDNINRGFFFLGAITANMDLIH